MASRAQPSAATAASFTCRSTSALSSALWTSGIEAAAAPPAQQPGETGPPLQVLPLELKPGGLALQDELRSILVGRPAEQPHEGEKQVMPVWRGRKSARKGEACSCRSEESSTTSGTSSPGEPTA